MAKYEVTRRLYRGGGNFIEPGQTAEFADHEAEPLLASGAIKQAAPAENKKAKKPSNKKAK